MTAVTANCIRYAQKALADWGTANSIPVGFKQIRDPLDGQDEKVIFRMSATHRPQKRVDQRANACTISNVSSCQVSDGSVDSHGSCHGSGVVTFRKSP